MTDLATLGVEIDTSKVRTASQDLKIFESIAKRTGETVEQVRVRFEGASNNTLHMAADMQKAASAISGVANAAQSASSVGGFLRAFASVVPMGGAVALAITGATHALDYFLSESNKLKNLEAVLNEHSRLVDLVKGSYDTAAGAAARFHRETREVMLLQTQMNLLQQQQALQAQSRSILNATTGPGVGRTLTGREQLISIQRELLPFRTAIEMLNRSAASGAPDITAYREELARIGLAAVSTNPKIAEQANALLKASNEAGDMAFKIKQAEAMLALLNNTATNAQKQMLGLSSQTKSATNSYDSMIQRTRDRIEEMRLEALVVGQAGEAVARLKLQHDLERAAKKSNIEATRELRGEWSALASEMEKAMQALSVAKTISDLTFERAQLGRTDIEQRIAATLRQAGNVDPNTVSGQLIANQVRLNEELKLSKELALDFTSTFTSELRNSLKSGENFWQSFADAGLKALGRITDGAATTSIETFAKEQ